MFIDRHIVSINYIQTFFVCVLVLIYGVAIGQDDQIKNGVNIQASYFNNGNVNFGWELMKSYPAIEALRIEIEPYRRYEAKKWVREAHENGYQVIATYHNSRKLGSDNKEELIDAAKWWKDNYASLSQSGPIIINIMNEWGSHDISPSDYAKAYNEAIEIIRTVYSGRLIVDVPGFGQATKIAADAYNLIEDQNIIYSVHVYTNAFNIEKERWLSSDDLSYLEATGANCMVGEFCDNSSGGADWCSIIDDCYASGWPIFGWAWNGDGHGMNMIEPHWEDEPLAQTFRPTEFMNKVIEKLEGVACYSQPDEDCNSDRIGEVCDDHNEYTVNDRYNENCHCIGSFTTQLESNLQRSDLIIYPNPVSGGQDLSIELFKIHQSGEINILNSLGELIVSKPINASQNRISIDTRQLSKGLYWVSFKAEDMISVAKAFVVN